MTNMKNIKVTKIDDVEYVNKINWGTPKHWGKLKIKYIPTGEIKEIDLQIKRMSYHNELIICDSWGYDKGSPTDLNNPDNYEIIDIEIDKEIKSKEKN